MFHYQPEDNPNKVVNVGYRYRNDQVRYDQTTGKWQWAVATTAPRAAWLHQGLLQDPAARLLGHLADRSAVERDQPLAV
jgi:hypothetical protein